MYNCFIILKHKFFAFFFLTKKKAKKPNLRKKKMKEKKDIYHLFVCSATLYTLS